MLITKTINYSKLISSERFDAKYFFLEDKLMNIPSDMEVVNLGDERLLEKITDGEHAGQVFVDEGVLFIKNSSIKSFDISMFDGFYISEEKHSKLQRSALAAEDVLFTTIGHIGSSAIVPLDFEEANINQNLVKMEINKDFINPYYLSAYLNSNLVKEQINCLFTSNTHKIMTYPKIKQLQIIKPSKDFQEKIANYYKEAIVCENKSNKLIIDAKLKFREYLNIDFDSIVEKTEYSTMLSDIIEGDLWTPKFSYYKYKLIANEIENKWPYITLNSKEGAVKIFTGSEVGRDNYIDYLNKKEGDYPFIRTSDVYNYQMDLQPDFFVEKSVGDEINQDICPNDIIFTKDGKIGCVGMITEHDKVFIASGLAVIRAININPYYLFLNLITEEVGQYQAIQRTVYASTIPHLRKPRIEEFKIPLISDDKIIELSSMIEEAFKLKNQKKVLISKINSEMDKLTNN
ncbi:restriction endonuclease subunit S [uncultured Methanobrevibacter sp.]|uniref:restriction endonuclease subunit S n=1 Tax=uncultured Methanobrevibacter sp. TaxID=253161 RepID=UPI0025EC3768|nr:restriction endonuclease subunit S [uncultured Methanobrevibacter sp.]